MIERPDLIGAVFGGLLGFAIGSIIAGGKYRSVGRGWYEMVEEPTGCLGTILVMIVGGLIGAAAGYIIGGLG
jgi:hypothetical protein